MERIFLIFGICVLVLLSPITAWWLTPSLPWYLPFLIWFIIILLIPWAHHRIEKR